MEQYTINVTEEIREFFENNYDLNNSQIDTYSQYAIDLVKEEGMSIDEALECVIEDDPDGILQ